MYFVVSKLKQLKPSLVALNKEKYPHIVTHAKDVRQLVTNQQQFLDSDLDIEVLQRQENDAREFFLCLSKAAHAFMATWLVEGDDNTCFYHRLLRKQYY